MYAKNVVIGVGVFATVIFLSFIVLFFFTLNTTISDFSMGDASVINQMYYNFFNGRPFQISVCTEVPTQFINPYPYLNVLVMHGYILSAAIVSFFYVLWPGINTMYTVFIILNYVGFAFFTFKIIQRLSPSNAYLKSLLAFSVFLLSGYLRQTILCGYPITMCGPFILAAYYFLISGKKTAFFLTIVSLCLIQDDLAIFAITFLIVLLIFERKCKKIIYLSIAFSLGYFILWNFIMQSFLRHDLILVSNRVSSMLLVRFYEIVDTISLWRPDPKKWLTVYSSFYLPALAAIIIYRFFGSLRRLPWLKIFSFVFLAPIAHWIYGSYTLSGRHLLPALVMTYLSFLLFLSGINFDWKKRVALGSLIILFAAAGIFLSVNVVVMTPVLPFSPRIYTWKIVKQLTGIEIFKGDEFHKKIVNNDEWRKQVLSNKETIKTVKNIPTDKSVVFWGNYTIRGFITSRNDIWFFPLYYDLADFLVIQKGARYSSFVGEDLESLDYKRPELREKFYNAPDGVLSDKLVEKIREELVDNKHTHRVMRDDAYVLVLERLMRYKFYIPKSSMGFVW